MREVADTDGGAHVDSGLKAEYERFSRFGMGGIFAMNSNDAVWVTGAHTGAMRQIAHEVLLTLSETAPSYFGDRYVARSPFEPKT